MSYILNVVTSGLRQLLLASIELQALVPNLERNITQEDPFTTVRAPNNRASTYIVLDNLIGGFTHASARDPFDLQVMVVCISLDQSTAALAAGYISTALMNRQLMLNEGYYCFAPVREMYPMSQVYALAGKSYYQLGSVYRIRGLKGN